MSTRSSLEFALQWWLRQMSGKVTRPCAPAAHGSVPSVTPVRHNFDGELLGQNNTSTKWRRSRRVQRQHQLELFPHLLGLTPNPSVAADFMAGGKKMPNWPSITLGRG